MRALARKHAHNWFADLVATRMAEEHATLAARWFARLRELLPVSDNEVFPSNSLLDHIPSLIVDISGYVRTPDGGPLAAISQVTEKARELGSLRHQQQASLHQVLREYQLLAQILVHFVEEEAAGVTTPSPNGAECVAVAMRVQQAVMSLLQETVERFVGLYTATIESQNHRLEQFTLMAAHEWRQPLGALSTATMLLRMAELDPSQRQTVDMIHRNVKRLIDMTVTLEKIARIDAEADNAMLQEVHLTTVAKEAARQVRDMAQANQVDIRVSADMPMLRVDVGRLELSLVNLLSNAIKYADPGKPNRIVNIAAHSHSNAQCEISVVDNGLGIPAGRLGDIFGRFTRAHTEHVQGRYAAGVGLGLSIVADCVQEMGGRIEVDSTEGKGSSFTIILPMTPPASTSNG